MNLASLLTGGIMDGASKIIGQFVQDPDEKAKAELAMKELVQKETAEKEQTIRTTMKARERIMVAELQQSDNYTKRARPTVVYFGLGMISFNYCIVPVFTLFKPELQLTAFNLPAEFWMAWGGIVATWSVGRSAEKFGVTNKAVQMITGNKQSKPRKTTKPPITDLFDDWSY